MLVGQSCRASNSGLTLDRCSRPLTPLLHRSTKHSWNFNTTQNYSATATDSGPIKAKLRRLLRILQFSTLLSIRHPCTITPSATAAEAASKLCSFRPLWHSLLDISTINPVPSIVLQRWTSQPTLQSYHRITNSRRRRFERVQSCKRRRGGR